MQLYLQEITLPLDHQESDIRRAVAKRLGLKPSEIALIKPVRRSIDARLRLKQPVFVYHLEVTLSDGTSLSDPLPPKVEVMDDVEDRSDTQPHKISWPAGNSRPVVVGAGPAGLLAALVLAEAGAKPVLLERGEEVKARSEKVARFWQNGELDPESNVLYGIGGAGLFSDGKLTSRSKDRRRLRLFLETLVECGADPDILIDAQPHLGTDTLGRICPALVERICRNGGEVRYGSQVEGIHVEGGALRGLVVNGEEVQAETCILATGHSARDIYRVLADSGVVLEAKPFAVGVRVEVAQNLVDRSQWGRAAGHPRLGAASFRLTRKATSTARACYSFCMCPGGRVIACASEAGGVTTNGMSNSARDSAWGNAAFLVPVGPEDFNRDNSSAAVLAGIDFQRLLEERIYTAGGGDYKVPAMMLADFLKDRESSSLPETPSSSRAVPATIGSLLPEYVTHTLRNSLSPMLRQLGITANDEVILYAGETRSSSPVRICRDEKGEAVNVTGLYPCGEGSGYAGGIVSSAIDGIKAAEMLLACIGD